jgi:hypothetical protein
VLLALFFGLFFVSLRLVALVAVVRMCLKGRQHLSRVRQLNQVIVYSLLRIVAEEEGLASIKENIDDPDRPFDKKTSDYASFEKKSKERLAEILQIEFDPAIFSTGRTLK